MKFIFVDAENIGLKEVESIEASVSDKVFVFSKNEAVKNVCERKLFLYISSYPVGSNQADFYLIGNLVGLILSLTPGQKPSCEFVLYSRDNSLVTAFSFQCKLHKAKSTIALEPKKSSNVVSIKKDLTLDQKILNLLKNPYPSETIRKKLNAEKPEFTRAINELIKDGKIKRQENSKKNWIKAGR